MPPVLKVNPDRPERAKIAAAVGTLVEGGVVAFPTETFYGLGADARNEEAVEKVFRIKGRDFRNPIGLIVAETRQVAPLVEEIPATAEILMKLFWPGPLTLLFRARPVLPHRLLGGTGKIGIRVSSHPIAQQLAAGVGGPVTATSANLSGGPECSSAAEVVHALGDLPDRVIDGGSTPGRAGSTILDVTVSPPRVLREGALPGDQVLAALAGR